MEESVVSRIPLVPVSELTPEQRDNYENRPGGKLNLNRLLAHAVAIQPGISQAVRGMMTGTKLPPLERQVCILAVLHLDRGAYEWAQHFQVSKTMGIPDAKIEAIADDRFGDPVFDDRERALLAFTRQVVKTVRVDDFVFDAVASFYSPRQIVELIHVIGLYMLFARVSEVAELEIDAIAGGEFWKKANREAGVID
jgi:alkylhydroperoxidase family enzyme